MYYASLSSHALILERDSNVLFMKTPQCLLIGERHPSYYGELVKRGIRNNGISQFHFMCFHCSNCVSACKNYIRAL